jgi:hypothetical protein
MSTPPVLTARCDSCGIGLSTWGGTLMHLVRCQPRYALGVALRIGAPVLFGIMVGLSATVPVSVASPSVILTAALILCLSISLAGWMLMRSSRGVLSLADSSRYRVAAYSRNPGNSGGVAHRWGIVAFLRRGGWRFLLALVPAVWLLARVLLGT